MPTASTAQILGNNESFEPYTSNIYSRRVLSGEFQVLILCLTCRKKCTYDHQNNTGLVRVIENLENPAILLWHFPGLESPGKRLLVLESSGNLLNSSTKYELYGRQ